LQARTDYYGREIRWLESAFWRRRQSDVNLKSLSI
jgi:hypothetical protein